MALRLATFNLKDFFVPRLEGERAVVEAKVANVAANLRRANADVVALQEVGAPELLKRLVERELAALGYGASVVGTEDRRGLRNAILSRLPLLWSHVHAADALPFPAFVEGDPDPFPGRIPLRRGVVHVRVDAGGGLGEVDVLTAHFKSGLPFARRTKDGAKIADETPRDHGESAVRSLVLRAAEALYVRGLVDDLLRASPDRAVCVMGDLNDTAGSLPLRLVMGVAPLDQFRLWSCTEDVAAERRFSCYHGGGTSLIDHVLVSERLFRARKEVAIYNEALRYHGPFVEGAAELCEDSDHALVTVLFDAPSAPASRPDP
jgi:endonuclease/exonuclease/phosphatase family metal-dependent hydrolase